MVLAEPGDSLCSSTPKFMSFSLPNMTASFKCASCLAQTVAVLSSSKTALPKLSTRVLLAKGLLVVLSWSHKTLPQYPAAPAGVFILYSSAMKRLRTALLTSTSITCRPWTMVVSVLPILKGDGSWEPS